MSRWFSILDIYFGLNPNTLKSTNAFLLTFQGFGVNFRLLSDCHILTMKNLRYVLNDVSETERCKRRLVAEIGNNSLLIKLNS